MKKYKGIDFSGEWRVVTFEGSTISAPWAFVKDAKGNVTRIVRDEDKIRPLAGFSNYRHAAQAAHMFGGTPVRM